jgi:hypothetical protein
MFRSCACFGLVPGSNLLLGLSGPGCCSALLLDLGSLGCGEFRPFTFWLIASGTSQRKIIAICWSCRLFLAFFFGTKYILAGLDYSWPFKEILHKLIQVCGLLISRGSTIHPTLPLLDYKILGFGSTFSHAFVLGRLAFFFDTGFINFTNHFYWSMCCIVWFEFQIHSSIDNQSILARVTMGT